MKPLPERLTKYGYTLTQIKREGNIAIYRASKNTDPPFFDVIIIQRHEGFTVAGRYIEPAETYPSSEHWGTYAWTLCTYKAAEEKFKALTEERHER